MSGIVRSSNAGPPSRICSRHERDGATSDLCKAETMDGQSRPRTWLQTELRTERQAGRDADGRRCSVWVSATSRAVHLGLGFGLRTARQESRAGKNGLTRPLAVGRVGVERGWFQVEEEYALQKTNRSVSEE